jgi:adenosylcobinamide-GDP ribazoletransferase
VVAPGSPPSRARRTRKLDSSVRPRARRCRGAHARAAPAPGVFEQLRLLAVAVGFLTRAPVPRIDVEADDLRRASAFFPLVGLGVAGAGVAVRAAVEPLWGNGVATIAAIAAMIAVTGAFHEDGLADTADGLWGGWDPAARLAIMRDSRIGTYGTIALITALGLRASLLLPLGLADFARAVACGHVLGRASTLLLARLLPAAPGSPETSAEPEGPPTDGRVGSLPTDGRVGGPPAEPLVTREAARAGQTASGGRPRLGASVVGALSAWGVAVAVVVVAATLGLAVGPWAPLPLAAGLVVCLGCARLFRRRLEGISGDALGAANQVVDLAAVAVVVALARAGLL